MVNNQMAQYDLITKEKLNSLTFGDTAPSAPVKGWTWIDTTLAMPILKIYDGSAWRDLIASGIIMMWSGTIGAIPAGYKICDGLNSTPDLRDKFVRGAAVGTGAGATGGFDTVTHSSGGSHTHNAIANHNHSGSTVSVATHTTAGGHTGHGAIDAPQMQFATVGGTGQFATDLHDHDDLMGDHAHNAHSETLTLASTDGHTHTSTGSGHTDHGTHDNKPVYYAVLYIMKI
jgi:hypothetical protein